MYKDFIIFQFLNKMAGYFDRIGFKVKCQKFLQCLKAKYTGQR